MCAFGTSRNINVFKLNAVVKNSLRRAELSDCCSWSWESNRTDVYQDVSAYVGVLLSHALSLTPQRSLPILLQLTLDLAPSLPCVRLGLHQDPQDTGRVLTCLVEVSFPARQHPTNLRASTPSMTYKFPALVIGILSLVCRSSDQLPL